MSSLEATRAPGAGGLQGGSSASSKTEGRLATISPMRGLQATLVLRGRIHFAYRFRMGACVLHWSANAPHNARAARPQTSASAGASVSSLYLSINQASSVECSFSTFKASFTELSSSYSSCVSLSTSPLGDRSSLSSNQRVRCAVASPNGELASLNLSVPPVIGRRAAARSAARRCAVRRLRRLDQGFASINILALEPCQINI